MSERWAGVSVKRGTKWGVGVFDPVQCSAGHRMIVTEATTEPPGQRGRVGSGLGLWADQSRLNRQTAQSLALSGPCAIR